MTTEIPVIVVGAGVAGLTAAIDLGRSGVPVIVLEARERIGGRVYTRHVSDCDAPIELGAEFIQGKPPEIWNPLEKNGKTIDEVDGDNWCVSPKGLEPCEFFSEVEDILGKMDDSSPDESFLAFLERRFPGRSDSSFGEAKQHAINYVSGFNAADPALVGVHWLVREIRAEERIGGDRAFRAENGYADLLSILKQQIKESGASVRTNTIVERIDWGSGHATVHVRDESGKSSVLASSVVITVPLGVLKAKPGAAGAIQFDPPLPAEKINALDKLEMGEVIRVVLQFRERFWENIQPSPGRNLADMSFLFSQDEWFPTWWTTMPKKYPVITGWAPFLAGRNLSSQDRSFVTNKACRTLARLLGIDVGAVEKSLVEAHFHDWQSDPFSQGAYSYGKVGADGAQAALASPLGGTLFFAGEATDSSGDNGSVQAAIASGHRAAAEIARLRPSVK